MANCAGAQPGFDRRDRLGEGLAFLATVGSTAPFIGLFGTVIGIYRALIKIGASGQASIDAVAGPVGEALIMTALGLVVAVPAVLAYNWLIRRNKSIVGGARGLHQRRARLPDVGRCGEAGAWRGRRSEAAGPAACRDRPAGAGRRTTDGAKAERCPGRPATRCSRPGTK